MPGRGRGEPVGDGWRRGRADAGDHAGFRTVRNPASSNSASLASTLLPRDLGEVTERDIDVGAELAGLRKHLMEHRFGAVEVASALCDQPEVLEGAIRPVLVAELSTEPQAFFGKALTLVQLI